MTDETATGDIDDQSEEIDALDGVEDLEGGSKKSGRKKLLLIVLPILLLGGGGAGVWFSGLADSLLGKEKTAEVAEEEHAAEPEHGTVYYDLPQMLVNLSTSGRRTSFLKIVVSLEMTSEADKVKLEEALPRIIDNFQVYLRELRVEDLRGSAGLHRLREELLFRVNAAVSPVRVTDVLFREMLVQ